MSSKTLRAGFAFRLQLLRVFFPFLFFSYAVWRASGIAQSLRQLNHSLTEPSTPSDGTIPRLVQSRGRPPPPPTHVLVLYVCLCFARALTNLARACKVETGEEKSGASHPMFVLSVSVDPVRGGGDLRLHRILSRTCL